MEFEDTGIDETWTAYHEAGHCVMAVVLGGTVDRASIVPDDDGYCGKVEVRWKRSITTEIEILVAMSGPVAEMIYRGEPFHPAGVPEWAGDWNAAWTAAGRRVRREIDRMRMLELMISKLHRSFRRDENWAAIAAVSDRLLAFEQVEHEEIAYEISNWLME